MYADSSSSNTHFAVGKQKQKRKGLTISSKSDGDMEGGSRGINLRAGQCQQSPGTYRSDGEELDGLDGLD